MYKLFLLHNKNSYLIDAVIYYYTNTYYFEIYYILLKMDW